MKKRIFLSVISIFALMMSSVSMAADGILDFLDFAGVQDNTFGYSSDDVLAIKDVSSSSIDVESPIVKKSDRNITSYIFNVSTSRGNDRPTAYWCFYDISDDITSNGNKFRISLDVDTNSLRSDTVYYVYATPVDGLTVNGNNGKCTLEDVENFFDNGVLGRESIANGKDPCFKIDGRIYGDGSYCENHTSGGGGSSSTNTSSASVYAIRSVSHTINGNNISLTWESLGADVSVEILLWYESSQSWRKIGTVNSEDNSFTFRAVHNGDHILKFNLEDPYLDIDYTAHYLQTESPEVKPVEPDVKPVVVGPKENILMILFGTLILYIVYRVAARKRS